MMPNRESVPGTNNKSAIEDETCVSTDDKCEEVQKECVGTSDVSKITKGKVTVHKPTVIYLTQQSSLIDSPEPADCSENPTSESSEETLMCPFCEYLCSGGANLKSHLLKHAGQKLYQCTTCSNVYSDRNDLKQHIQTHASAVSYRYKSKKPEHYKPTNTDTPGQRLTYNGYYHCPNCVFKTKNKVNFSSHDCSQVSHLPYGCRVCKRRFLAYAHLVHHMLTHFKKKSHVCRMCNCSYTGRDKLREHVKRYHNSNPKAFSSQKRSKKKPAASSRSKARVFSRDPQYRTKFQSPYCVSNSAKGVRSSVRLMHKAINLFTPEVVELSD